jgi:hypothetical protein
MPAELIRRKGTQLPDIMSSTMTVRSSARLAELDIRRSGIMSCCTTLRGGLLVDVL